MTNGRDMLVGAPERWDDACFSVPAVRALAASGLGVGVLCPERQKVLWESLHGVEVVAFPEKSKPRGFAGQLGGWASALVWEPGKAADFAAAARVPRRLGPPHRKLARWLTNPIDVKKPGPAQHRVRDFLAVVEELGVATSRLEFFAPVDADASRDPEAVLLCPDSDFGPSHEWLMERWAEVAAALSADGAKLSVVALPMGRGLGRALADRLSGGAELVELPSFESAVPLLSRHARLVAADGSLPHLAAHFGCTCVTLFGPNEPNWRRPLGRRHGVARWRVECSPCFQPKCPLDLRCQRELTAELVIGLVRRTPGSAVVL